MNHWVELIEDCFYSVPEKTECECEIYRLSNSLAGELSSGQIKELDSLIDKAIEHASEMAEDGFRQGVRAGIELMVHITLHQYRRFTPMIPSIHAMKPPVHDLIPVPRRHPRPEAPPEPVENFSDHFTHRA